MAQACAPAAVSVRRQQPAGPAAAPNDRHRTYQLAVARRAHGMCAAAGQAAAAAAASSSSSAAISVSRVDLTFTGRGISKKVRPHVYRAWHQQKGEATDAQGKPPPHRCSIAQHIASCVAPRLLSWMPLCSPLLSQKAPRLCYQPRAGAGWRKPGGAPWLLPHASRGQRLRSVHPGAGVDGWQWAVRVRTRARALARALWCPHIKALVEAVSSQQGAARLPCCLPESEGRTQVGSVHDMPLEQLLAHAMPTQAVLCCAPCMQASPRCCVC